LFGTLFGGNAEENVNNRGMQAVTQENFFLPLPHFFQLERSK